MMLSFEGESHPGHNQANEVQPEAQKHFIQFRAVSKTPPSTLVMGLLGLWPEHQHFKIHQERVLGELRKNTTKIKGLGNFLENTERDLGFSSGWSTTENLSWVCDAFPHLGWILKRHRLKTKRWTNNRAQQPSHLLLKHIASSFKDNHENLHKAALIQ